MTDFEEHPTGEQEDLRYVPPDRLRDPAVRRVLIDTVRNQIPVLKKAEREELELMAKASGLWDATATKLRGWLVAWGVSTILIAFQTANWNDPLPKWSIVISIILSLLGLGLLLWDTLYDSERCRRLVESSSKRASIFTAEAHRLESDLITLVHWQDGLNIGYTLQEFEPPEVYRAKKSLHDHLFPAAFIALGLGTLTLLIGFVIS